MSLDSPTRQNRHIFQVVGLTVEEKRPKTALDVDSTMLVTSAESAGVRCPTQKASPDRHVKSQSTGDKGLATIATTSSQ